MDLCRSTLRLDRRPLFALSHHLIIWWAAEKEMPGKKFRHYAVLGDDVVIGDMGVAKWYRYAMDYF